jgi:hypothetical protein
MNPDELSDLIARLRGLFASPPDTATPRPLNPRSRVASNTAPEMTEFFTSPTADSLYQLFGLPQRLGTEEMTGAFGTYDRGNRELNLRRQGNQDGLGYSGDVGFPEKQVQWVPDTSFAGRRRSAMAHEMGHHARPMLNNPRHSRTLPLVAEEDRASLAAQVFDMLSKTGNVAPDSVTRSLNRLDAQFSGGKPATDMARFILERPSNVFAGHPAKAALRTPR